MMDKYIYFLTIPKFKSLYILRTDELYWKTIFMLFYIYPF